MFEDSKEYFSIDFINNFNNIYIYEKSGERGYKKAVI